MESLPVIVAILVFVWYLRKDSKDDYIRLDADLKSFRHETAEILKAIHEEIKEFHGRLCGLEEREKK